MKQNYWLAILIALVGVAFLGGYLEGQKTPLITCDSPYIKIGNSCCLDRNQNKLCDNDETKKELLRSCLKDVENCTRNAPGDCTTDTECINRANRYCGQLLSECGDLAEEKCEFGPFGAECK